MRRRRTALVVVAGALLSLVGTLLAAWDTGSDVRDRLEERADRAAAVLDLQLQRYASASRAVAALRADDPGAQEWLARVDRLGVAADLPSTYSIAAAAGARRPERSGHLRAVDCATAPPVRASRCVWDGSRWTGRAGGRR